MSQICPFRAGHNHGAFDIAATNPQELSRIGRGEVAERDHSLFGSGDFGTGSESCKKQT